MKALVIGQGGREHALVRALKHAPSMREVHAAPGSDGIALEIGRDRCHPITWQQVGPLLELCARQRFDFVIIGPENPLVEGLADTLRAAGVHVVAPSREAARLEGSKIFCKEFLLEAGVPTARSFIVSTVPEAVRAAQQFHPPYVLKADGLAAGKGVFICKTLDELKAAAHAIFVERSLGESGARALIEEFSPGYEISYLVLTNGDKFTPLPLAQDHKRLLDGDNGPNTGGMGVVAPVAIPHDLRARIDLEVVLPSIRHLKSKGLLYRGVLFIGLMITDQGPSVLEFNTRFGDPETQAVLPLLDGDWGVVFRELAKGHLTSLKWKSLATCCVVLAAEGYPDAPVKDVPIEGVSTAGKVNAYLLHAGTKQEANGKWLTAGGRVLNAVAVELDLSSAIEKAYELARTIKSKGLQMRTDIGSFTNSSEG